MQNRGHESIAMVIAFIIAEWTEDMNLFQWLLHFIMASQAVTKLIAHVHPSEYFTKSLLWRCQVYQHMRMDDKKGHFTQRFHRGQDHKRQRISAIHCKVWKSKIRDALTLTLFLSSSGSDCFVDVKFLATVYEWLRAEWRKTHNTGPKIDDMQCQVQEDQARYQLTDPRNTATCLSRLSLWWKRLHNDFDQKRRSIMDRSMKL